MFEELKQKVHEAIEKGDNDYLRSLGDKLYDAEIKEIWGNITNDESQ